MEAEDDDIDENPSTDDDDDDTGRHNVVRWAPASRSDDWGREKEAPAPAATPRMAGDAARRRWR